MEVLFRRNHNDSYMVVEGSARPIDFEYEMIENNQISSLLKFYCMEMNGKNQFWYNITGKQSLKDYMEQTPMDFQVLERIFTYLYLACEEIEKYLIDQSHVLMSPEYIYLDKSDNCLSFSFCYYPQNDDMPSDQFRGVLEHLLTVVNHDRGEFMDFCYGIYDIALRNHYSIKELLNLISAKRIEADDIYVEQIDMGSLETPFTKTESPEYDSPINKSGYGTPYQSSSKYSNSASNYSSFYDDPNRQDVFPDEPYATKKRGGIIGFLKSLIFVEEEEEEIEMYGHEDFVFDPSYEYGEKTMLLTGSVEVCSGKLIYDGTRGEENYLIEKDIFCIGTKKEKNDAVLHSKTVSKNHAKITRRGNDYYVEDLNSTNGTFLNGKQLDYHRPVKLSAMDTLMFADVKYVFY